MKEIKPLRGFLKNILKLSKQVFIVPAVLLTSFRKLFENKLSVHINHGSDPNLTIKKKKPVLRINYFCQI